MAQVIIYTTPTCAYCKMAKEFFKKHDVDYVEKDVAADQSAAQEMIQKSGQMGVPVISVDDNIVIGFDPMKLSQLLGLNK